MEEAYIALSTPEKCTKYCHALEIRYANAVKKLPISQWYLESAELAVGFLHSYFTDAFETDTTKPSWIWINEFGVGIHAIGMIDRTIYCGAYKEGTATVFRNFRIWIRD